MHLPAPMNTTVLPGAVAPNSPPFASIALSPDAFRKKNMSANPAPEDVWQPGPVQAKVAAAALTSLLIADTVPLLEKLKLAEPNPATLLNVPLAEKLAALDTAFKLPEKVIGAELPALSAIRPIELPGPPKVKFPDVGRPTPPLRAGSLVNPTRNAPGLL